MEIKYYKLCYGNDDDVWISIIINYVMVMTIIDGFQIL